MRDSCAALPARDRGGGGFGARQARDRGIDLKKLRWTRIRGARRRSRVDVVRRCSAAPTALQKALVEKAIAKGKHVVTPKGTAGHHGTALRWRRTGGRRARLRGGGGRRHSRSRRCAKGWLPPDRAGLWHPQRHLQHILTQMREQGANFPMC